MKITDHLLVLLFQQRCKLQRFEANMVLEVKPCVGLFRQQANRIKVSRELS